MSVDPAELKEVCEWMTSVGPNKVTVDSFPEDWKNGVILCEFANALKPGSVKFKKRATMPFVAMENVNAFTKFCTSCGVPDRSNFVTVDLREEKDLRMVMITMLDLKRSLGFGVDKSNTGPKGTVFDYEPPK